MLRLFYLQDYLYSPITQLFLKYFNDNTSVNFTDFKN